MIDATDSPSTPGSERTVSPRTRCPTPPIFSASSSCSDLTYLRPATRAMDYGLEEELVAIESIYGPNIITKSSSDSAECTLHVPNTAGVQLRLLFPPDYPDSAPDVDKVVSTGGATAHGWGGHVLETVRALVGSAWTPGETILYSLLDELQEGGVFNEKDAYVAEGEDGERPQRGGNSDEEDVDEWPQWSLEAPKQWFVSDVASEKKSTFIAHAAAVASPVEAKLFTEALIASDKKFEKATHNIRAWRGRFTPEGGDRELVFQDCDDDGEDAAGGRLLHLLELTESWNVLVVVSRWYGGIKLGPDRFRIINQVARDALVKGGFVKEESKKTAKKAK